MSDSHQQNIIFVTGASRSGTTLLSLILNNNSQIFGLKETQYFGEFWTPGGIHKILDVESLTVLVANILARQSRGVFNNSVNDDEYAKAAKIVESLDAEDRTAPGVYAAVVGRIASDAGKGVACEQTPRNIFYARYLLDLYPNSHIVHMLRDPRAVMASQKKRWQRRKLSSGNIPFRQTVRAWVNYHPFTMAKLWNKASTAALTLKGHPRFMMMRFEDLLDNPENNLVQLCQYLGVAYESDMLNVSHVNSSYSSVSENTQGVNKNAIDTWRSVLTDGEIRVTEFLTGANMSKLNYQKVSDNRVLLPIVRYSLSYFFHIVGVLFLNPHRALIQLRALFNV